MPLNITNAQPLFQRGVAFHQAGKLADARQCYLGVLQTNPAHAPALHDLALVALAHGENQAAFDYVQRSLQVDAKNAEAYNTLGEIYRTVLMGDQAIAAFDKAIQLNPRLYQAHNNLGIVKAIQGHVHEALAAWNVALQLTADDAAAAYSRATTLNNIGNVHLELGHIPQAIEAHTQAVCLDPAYIHGISNLLRDHNHLSDFSPEQMLTLHRHWTAQATRHIKPIAQHSNSRDPNRRLRIGFVSPDFREHAVCYFLLGLFEAHDAKSFDFIAYANVPHPDNFTRAIERHCSAFRNIIPLGDEQAAQLIQQDGIDILIDLAGHTAGNRFPLFAYKPAPVQISYLGYPQTSGLGTMDWRITDSLADPPGVTDAHFAEKLYRLSRPAWCYRPPVEVAIANDPCSRSDSRPFTFGSFNSYPKITAETVGLWATLLQRVPGSRLFLKSNILQEADAREEVLARFGGHGVGAERLILRGRQPATADHLREYQHVDLALDTPHYHGTTTTCEALYMNVPVVTLGGGTHMSRVGVSLLTAVGLTELIAKSPEEYLAIAVRLATESETLAHVRTNLRQKFQGSSLMDASNFAHEFCVALRTIWQEWCE